MVLHDGADMETIVRETVAAFKEGARRIGKADPGISNEQIGEIETALRGLQRTLDMKKQNNRLKLPPL